MGLFSSDDESYLGALKFGVEIVLTLIPVFIFCVLAAISLAFVKHWLGVWIVG
ncbi:hypothetical protein [Shewanella sp. TB7-MNA-CIBAN-0143]|uniref:hypothetical protein n=1 Tax=Shewanella sp. TB7-MNA-CIBAN-0143 TaxID=3140465 RepID=UPI0033301348